MKRSKCHNLLALLLSFAVAAACLITTVPAETFADPSAQTGKWYDSIPEMLSAGDYEEGVVLAGIDLSKAKNENHPETALASEKLKAGAEEILRVDAEDALQEEEFRAWMKERKAQAGAGQDDTICITSLSRNDMTTGQMLKLLASDDSIVFAEPNYIADMDANEEDTPPAGDVGGRAETADVCDVSALQWSSSTQASFRGAGDPGNVSMNVPGWPNGSNMEQEIVVAVLDYPVDFTNPDLKDRAYTFTPELQAELGCDVHGFNSTWESKDGKLEYFENCNHGSHVAGIIGASWDGKGINGVGSDIRLVSVQISNDDGKTSLVNALRGMEFLVKAKQKGVDIRITNNSWGLYQDSRALNAAVTKLGENGIVSFFSAGNDGTDLSIRQSIDNTVFDNPYAILVAASDATGNLADFSNYGTESVTLAAPGVDILSCAYEKTYLPPLSENNAFYENFEGDSSSVSVYQIDPNTGEKVEGTDGVITESLQGMGFEGEHVLKVPVNHAYESAGRYYDNLCTFRITLKDAALQEADPEALFGFAFGGSKIVGIYESAEELFGTTSHRGSWSVYSKKPALAKSGSDLSFTVFMTVDGMGEVYLDTIGLGTEMHPYRFLSGTSMASPAAAGGAAVLASRHYEELKTSDEESAYKLAEYVRKSVRPLPALSDKVQCGGILDLAVDASAEDPALHPAPDITDVSVDGTEVLLSGSGFGNSAGSVSVRKSIIGTEQEALSGAVNSWSDNLVTYSLPNEFEGILEAELTAENGKKDTFIKFISKSSNLFEKEHSLDSGTGDPFAFDPPDEQHPDTVRMGDSESSGILLPLGDKLYYMPTVAEVEKDPAYRSLFCYDPETDSWSTCPSYPVWIYGASGTSYNGKLYVKGQKTKFDESTKVPYYDAFDLADPETCIYSYTPGEDSWTECSSEQVYAVQTLFSTESGLMLAGSVFLKEDGAVSDTIRSYDPASGGGDIVGKLPSWFGNPIVTYAFGRICLSKNSGQELYVLDDDWMSGEATVIDMPLKEKGQEEDAYIDSDRTQFSLAGDEAALYLSWSDYREGTADTYVLYRDDTELKAYEKRASDAALFGPSSAVLGNELYVLSGSLLESEQRLFRSTKLQPYQGKLVILHSNDVHGAIEGYSKMAMLKKNYEQKGAEVLLVDAGDFMQGDPYVNTSDGLDAVRLMNAAGYQFAVPGNHEFDYGVEVLQKNLTPENAKFKMLCANLRINDVQPFESNAVYEAENGAKIGLVGLATPETKTKANPVLVKDITVSGSEEMAACATEQAVELKNKGADCVIALAHLGVDKESGLNQNRSVDLYMKARGIDFILDGHSHTVMTQGENGEPIQSTGTKFAYIGVLVINDQGEVETNYLRNTAYLPAEEEGEIAALTKEIKDKVDEIYSEVIGESEVELEGAKAANRSKETNNGDLVTDSMLWFVNEHPEVLNGFEGPVISIMNGGAIRDRIPKGNVTKKDVFTVHPFGNTINIVYVKGTELLEALEASTFFAPDLVGGYPQTAGIRFTINIAKKYDAGEKYQDSDYRKPKSIQRVSIQSVNGKPFDPNATYAVVTNNFVASGGDTYAVFKNRETMETGVYLDDNLVNYIQNELGGFITEEQYGKPRGDQTQISEPDPDPAPKVVKGKTYTVGGQKYVVTALASNGARGEVAFKKAKNSKKASVPASVKLPDGKRYNVTSVRAKAFTGKKIRIIVIGQNVRKICKNACRGSRAVQMNVKSKLLRKKTVKGSLRGSKITVVKVRVGTDARNRKYVKKYRKIFTKKNAGKKVTVKKWGK